MSDGVIYEYDPASGGYSPTWGDVGDVTPRPSPYSPPQCFEKPTRTKASSKKKRTEAKGE